VIITRIIEDKRDSGFRIDPGSPRAVPYWLARLRQKPKSLLEGRAGFRRTLSEDEGEAGLERTAAGTGRSSVAYQSKEDVFDAHRAALEEGDFDAADEHHETLKQMHTQEDYE
jgi:hypothetical protein